MGDRAFASTMSATCSASPEAVYDLLADPASHLVWAGERQDRQYRLTSLDAPPGAAQVGSGWTSTGTIPMSGHHWEDRSTVIAAERPRLFEFVTEGRVAARRPMLATCLNRYLIEPAGAGCRVTHELRLLEVTNPIARLRFPMRIMVFKVGIPFGSGRGLRNLLRMAETSPSAALANP